MRFDVWFTLLCISLVLITGFGAYLLRMRNKKQIHYAFLSLIISIFIWSLSLFFAALSNFSNMVYVYSYFFGVCFVPISITFLGLIFAYTKIDFNWKHILLFIFPIIDVIVILTNPYHHLFFVEYNPINTLMKYGMFFLIHTIVSYIYILIGIWYLLYYSIKNSGFFSRQSLLIILGTSFPLVLNMLENLNIVKLSTYTTPVAFSFTIVCFLVAILKFKFLNVVPVALQRIVDLISDSYIVINEELEIIDYNQTFVDTFKGVIKIKRGDSLMDVLLTNSKVDIDEERIFELNKRAIEKKKTVTFEKEVKGENFDKHFKIEIIPIYSQDSYIGSIILLKDITDHKKNIEIIKRNQEMLMEKERLASLGELIGGIAHNLKTPIMSLSGGLEGLDDLINEYDDSIDDVDVTKEDHHEIAKEMKDWIGKLKPHLSYMSEIITTVKDQAVHLNSSSSCSFTINELLKRVEILMKHELKKNYCTLNYNVNINEYLEISGEINNLIQVINNLIINAIHAYGEAGGEITLSIEQKDDNIELTVKDNACGMDDEVKSKLFKQMFTTKGKNGTGLGLYMSYSTIRGRFGGKMWFESEKNKGTTFYILIPIKRSEVVS